MCVCVLHNFCTVEQRTDVEILEEGGVSVKVAERRIRRLNEREGRREGIIDASNREKGGG